MEENFIKVSNAAYKVLGLFPEEDPIKNRAKEKVLAILENLTIVSDARGWASLKKEKALNQLLEDIEVLKVYLKLAKQQGFIDDVNFLILLKEYDNIKSQIYIVRPLPSVGGTAGQTEQFERKNTPQNNLSPNALVRQGKILKILSEKGGAQVSDIIKEIPDVTKRTIRRDLDDLLKKGKITRAGEFNQVLYRIARVLEQNPENKARFDRTTTLS